MKCAAYSASACSRWRRLRISIRSSSSRRRVPIQRSVIAFAWGARIGVRRMWMPSLANTASKTVVNLVSRSRIKEGEGRCAVVEVGQEIARLLGDPGSVRVRRGAQEVDAAGGVLGDEQHVEPVQQHRVDAEEVGGEDAVCLGGEDLSPGGAAAARCGVDAGSLQDRAHGAGRKLVAEPGEFAVDPPVAPGWVLRGQAQDQRAQLGCCGVAFGAAVSGLSPASDHQVSVPPHDRAGGDDSMQAASLEQQPGQRCEDCSVGPGQSRPTDLAAEHGDLAPEHQDLRVLRA